MALHLGFKNLPSTRVPFLKAHGTHGQVDSECALMIKVLDAVRGTPAAKLRAKLLKQKDDKSWDLLNSGITSSDGEIHSLITEEQFVEGIYKLQFATKPFWSKLGLSPFHEFVDVVFTANDAGHRHYTIAVLLTPYSFSTTAVVSDLLQEAHD
ncbi:transthyretin [Pseudophryne corroboree]|uniref:transthyretin n=1 Tax=Pseudophryne corroboree TaxID=495146 RepID=UPI00308122C2